MNKSKSLRSRKQVKSVLKTQYGGNTGAVLAEDGELFKDEYGQIQEIVGFTHESPFTQDEEGNLYYTGEGGQIVRAQSVLSDSYEKVKEGTRKSTIKEDTLKIKPKEARELFDFKWFKPTGKTYSPSSLVRDVATQRDKHLSRYDESRQNDSVSRDTNLLNESMLPSDDDIYEKVFDRQERVKGKSGKFAEEMKRQSGGLPVGQTVGGMTITPDEEIIVQDNGGQLKRIPGKRYSTDVDELFAEMNQRYYDAADVYRSKGDSITVRDSKYNIRNNQKVNKALLSDIVNASLNAGVDPYTAIAIAQRESGIGHFSRKAEGSQDRVIKEFNPQKVFSNWESSTGGLTAEELKQLREGRESYQPINDRIYNKVKRYSDMSNQYMFATEMDTIKKKGIKGYNPGDKDYENKINREREILMSDENKGFRDYVDSVIKQSKRKKQYGGVPVNPNGLYEEDGPVIIPSGDITMEGIDYPVDAYDANTGEYLETMQPNMNYNFDTDNVLEVPVEELDPKEKVRQAVNKGIEGAKVGLQEVRRILANAKHGGMPKAQTGYDNTSRTPDRRIKINGTDRTLNPEPYKPDHYVDQYGDVWKLEPNGEYTKTNLRHQETLKPQPASYSEYMTNEKDKYVVRRGDWISSVAPMFGLTEQELIELNPELSETGKIVPGMEINVMRPQPTVVPTNVSQEPVDRSNEINNIEELPEDINVEADQVTPDLKIEATTVPANTPEAQVVQEARKLLDKQRLGKLDRTQGTFAIREGMMQNRSVNLPYKMEVPRRTLGYVEEDVTPYLDEIDTSVNQQLQNINQNTAQGQAIMASVLNNANRAKRQTINQVNQANLQRRQQVDNQNNMLQNQFDLQQEQSNKQYVDETYETLAARDRNRMEVANAMDAMVNQNSRLNNTFLLENIKNPNFQIDPITGEIYRIGTPLKDVFNKTSTPVTKAKWGKRHNRRC